MKEQLAIAPLLPRSDGQPPAPDSIRSGAACPNCGQGELDYNGLLDLECPACGFVLSGGGFS
jgi:uncharacterized protein (DUF983 family)